MTQEKQSMKATDRPENSIPNLRLEEYEISTYIEYFDNFPDGGGMSG
jgi:hypothetical protein